MNKENTAKVLPPEEDEFADFAGMTPEEVAILDEKEEKADQRRREALLYYQRNNYIGAMECANQDAAGFKVLASRASAQLRSIMERGRIQQFAVYRAKLWADSTYTILDILASDERGTLKLLRFKCEEAKSMQDAFGMLEGRGYKEIIDKDKRLQEDVGKVVFYLLKYISQYKYPISSLCFDCQEENKPYTSVMRADSVKEPGSYDYYVNGWGMEGLYSFEFWLAAPKLDENNKELAYPWPIPER